MSTFDFLFGCSIGEIILKLTDNLSDALQNVTISASEGHALTCDVVATLLKDRSNEWFELFWTSLLKKKDSLNAHEAEMSRKRKMPDNFGKSSNTETRRFHETTKDRYRQIYYKIFDFITNCIKTDLISQISKFIFISKKHSQKCQRRIVGARLKSCCQSI